MGKSKATKPTRSQKALIKNAGLEPKDCLVLTDTKEVLTAVNWKSMEVQIINKAPVTATARSSR